LDVVEFALGALPAAPARVLEVGAGRGELALRLARAGYDVVAIDPVGEPPVLAVPLHGLDEPADSFDAAVAVLSLHHVEPLRESIRRLAEVVRPGGSLVVDEFDVAAFDLRAAEWLIDRWRERGRESPESAAALVADLREHLHPLARPREGLGEWFELGEVSRGAYLHRWDLDPALRKTEEELIPLGELPATGARFLGHHPN
jgi:SAM-dependent methyltransferase